MLIAGVARQGLWANFDGGADWTRLAADEDAGPNAIINRPSEIVYDPSHPDTFWESGIYNGPGVYRTDDNGLTILEVGTMTNHNDSVSVDFTDTARQTLLAGGHEQAGRLLLSTNGGTAWTDIGPQLPANAGYSSEALVVSPKVYLVGTYQGSASGVFRTTDGGSTWTQVYSAAVRGHPLVASDTSIYWLLATNAGLIRSTDVGLSWTQVTGTGILADYFGGASIIELPDARLLTLGTQSLLISANKGASWQSFGTIFPQFTALGVVYSTFRKMLYVWHDDCTFGADDPVLPNAIVALPFDYEKQ